MSREYHDIAFTSAVLDAQVQYGSRTAQGRLHHVTDADDDPTIDPPHFGTPARARVPRDPLGEAERAFIGEQDGFYLATVSQSGWPYVQFRGGPAGFVTTPDEHTLAWPDFRGNRQYVTTGNLEGESRVAMIFLDYARQARLKIFGVAEVRDVLHDPAAARAITPAHYPARVEREVRVQVSAFDWNCQQHITPRYTTEELDSAIAPLQRRLKELEQENAKLRRSAAQTASRVSAPTAASDQ
jgi:predicted pyridoxine 5'-phosphate oxidase superfamily flavin-nucleotide-binding protein